MDKKGHKNWPDYWAQRTVANLSMSTQEPVVGGAPWGLILGLVLCDAFISDLTDGRGCTLSKVTLSRRQAGMQEDREDIQSSLNKLEEYMYG